ncbi:flagellar motor protein MotD [Gilvimarinus algae]|uniref:Flagellar motor protein MotD n=1 Tax=Gilvimarinus algae TaxID=3058037 RepID=A0ABT8TG01_9GAMM|nr:flagellar motor protein MotD [Gilvimarinus sp. SDUM040014]MDO3382570.1 flagellar motor protein MotD [Gilvimarinus sp. SDUM040014]
MPRRRSSDLRMNHERWLVSYADFITLLFAFFVVMYSISQVNESKYRVLSDTLVEAFRPAARTANPIQVGSPAVTSETSVIKLDKPQSQGNLGVLEKTFRDEFDELVDDELMRISSNELWLQIELRDSILFDSGSAQASDTAREIFSKVADILESTDNPVQIEGFTDNLPIRTDRYPSNWELSSARASAIVKWMVAEGVDPSRLAAVGYGEHQPLAPNTTAEGRAQNRRVAIMIARDKMDRPKSQVSELSGELLDQVAAPDAEFTQGPSAAQNSADTITSDAPADTEVQAVEMGNGDLLFSSDPDLPRQGRE